MTNYIRNYRIALSKEVQMITREIMIGLLIPFAGFAAGVMTAASVWSLIIPAMEQSEGMGRFAFVPAFIGFWTGVLFLMILDRMVPLPL